MHYTHSPQPRFGTDYLFNWLSQPAENAEAQRERKLALAVFQRGRPVHEVSANRYSRQDWQLEHNGLTATLSFQNFAQRDGSNPRQFAAYTLTVSERSTEAGVPGKMLVHGVHETAYRYGTNEVVDQQDKVRQARPEVLVQLEASMPKPLFLHKASVLAAA